jgi:lysozyme
MKNHIPVLIAYVVLVLTLQSCTKNIQPTPNNITLPPHVANTIKNNITTDAESVHGIDVSHFQGDIDWHAVASSNIQFVYLKATDGNTYTDPSFHRNTKALSATTLEYGAYHFFEANDQPITQAENFIKVIKDIPLTLSPMVDVEIDDNQTPEVLQQRLKSFLTIVENSTGCKPLIYSNKNFWSLDIGPQFDDYVFWLAEYSQTPQLPAGIKNWDIWQYSQTGKITGIQDKVDLDVIMSGEIGLKRITCRQ